MDEEEKAFVVAAIKVKMENDKEKEKEIKKKPKKKGGWLNGNDQNGDWTWW